MLYVVPLLILLQAGPAGPAPLLYGAPPGPRTVENPLPDAALEAVAEDYDRTIRSNAQAADRMQGPLDGTWVLSRSDGAPLFRLQIVDPQPEAQAPEGAWRGLAGAGAAGTGLISSIIRSGARLQVRFDAAPGDLVVATLDPEEGGRWRGEIWRAGITTAARMTREVSSPR